MQYGQHGKERLFFFNRLLHLRHLQDTQALGCNGGILVIISLQARGVPGF